MYYKDRTEAGDMIAARLRSRFNPSECAVVAISEGGVVVGARVANILQCVMMLVVARSVEIPGESLNLGMVDEHGGFTYNSELAYTEIKEYTDEFHGMVDEKKREALGSISKDIGDGVVWNEKLLADKSVIIIDDGMEDTIGVDVAMNLLKPVRIAKFIVASPVVNVEVVDKLHVMADELIILDIRSNFLGTDHYYSDNTKPTTKEAIEYVSQIVDNWR